jgi:hypothetical protein
MARGHESGKAYLEPVGMEITGVYATRSHDGSVGCETW